MIYESSYESGQRPFVSDAKRGYWSSANDFIYAGLSLGFRLDVFALSWIATVESGVSGFLPTYLISLTFYVVPLLVVKSFMGQFSNSGFLSAMRLCPLLKGIGYVTLFLNICVLIYYSVFATIPLVYLIASFKPTLPWSCDGIREWTKANVTFCTTGSGGSRKGAYFSLPVASSLYFNELFTQYTVLGITFSVSWHLAVSAVCVWALLAFIIYKLSSTEKIGQMIRYSVWCIVSLLVLFIVRFSFLPGTIAHYERLFNPNWEDFFTEIRKLPLYGILAFGPGWGLFITLASFNRFKTNLTRSSWLIGIGQMFIIFGLDMVQQFINLVLKDAKRNIYLQTQFDTFFMSSGSVLATMEWPNLWSILFYTMLFLSSLVVMLLLLYSILTSIFDEFIWLRQHKLRWSVILISTLAVCSLYFSTLLGYVSSMNLLLETLISQSLINLLLILMVTWIYGRVRFQRDMTFMTNERFATWKIYVLRFFAPLYILVFLAGTLLVTFVFSAFGYDSLSIFNLFLKILPWWSIPAYIFYHLYKSKGSLKDRFVKCCRPTDWYPVEAVDRLRYEEVMNNSNMTHPLTELQWDAADNNEDIDISVN